MPTFLSLNITPPHLMVDIKGIWEWGRTRELGAMTVELWGPLILVQRTYHWHGLLKFASSVPLRGGPNATSWLLGCYAIEICLIKNQIFIFWTSMYNWMMNSENYNKIYCHNFIIIKYAFSIVRSYHTNPIGG